MGVNELEKRKLEILAVAYGLKQSELKNEEVQENYAVLFSAYRKMIMEDKDHFFVDTNRKKEICSSLDASMRALRTNKEGMREEFSQLKKGDRNSFLIFGQPTILSTKEGMAPSHCIGMLIYKNEKNDYSLYLIDKNKTHSPHSIVNKLIISKSKEKKLVNLLAENKVVTQINTKNEKFLKQLYKLKSQRIMSIPITMSAQTVENCYINEVEAAFKVSLFHCKHNMDSLTTSVTPKWNDLPDATLKMREKFKDALKVRSNETFDEICDKLFLIYKERKEEMARKVNNLGMKAVKYSEFGDKIREKAQKQTIEILTGKKSLETLKNHIIGEETNTFKDKMKEKVLNRTEKVK